MRKIILINQKGGCGKTTVAINLACCLAAADRKVLLLDLDPQGHAALGLGLQPGRMPTTVYEVLTEKARLFEAIRPLRANLDGLFSNVVLSAFETTMAGLSGREHMLANRINELQVLYDYLIVDSPPNVGLLTINGLMAATEAIIPVDPSPYSLNGLNQLLETITLIKKHTGHELTLRILASNVDRRTNFGRALIETLRSRFPKENLKTVINTSTHLRESAAQGRPINSVAPHSHPAHDFSRLTEEILKTEALKPRGLKTREVLFSFRAPAESPVRLAGDFTCWQPIRLTLDTGSGNSHWQKRLRLKPGSYQYKYLVDNNWITDPANGKKVDDGLGGVNSCFTV